MERSLFYLLAAAMGLNEQRVSTAAAFILGTTTPFPKGISKGNAYFSLGRARGPWPTWGRGVRLVRQALDVGLDPLVLSCQEERTKKSPYNHLNHLNLTATQNPNEIQPLRGVLESNLSDAGGILHMHHLLTQHVDDLDIAHLA